MRNSRLAEPDGTRSRKRWADVAAWLGAAVGSFLLVLALLGDVGGFGVYEGRAPRAWERYDADLVARVRDVDALLVEAASRRQGDDPESVMLSLQSTVADRFAHSNGARHTPLTNWVAWTAGKAVRPLAMMWSPADFLAHGDALVCSQSSYLLLALALREGIRARHVGLYGHVVMEAWYEDDWHLFDPDTEVVVRDAAGQIPSVEELALDAELLRASYTGDNAQYVDIIASREDNTYMSYPEGAWFGWRPQLLALTESVSTAAKYLVPLTLLGGALARWFATRPGDERRAPLRPSADRDRQRRTRVQASTKRTPYAP